MFHLQIKRQYGKKLSFPPTDKPGKEPNIGMTSWGRKFQYTALVHRLRYKERSEIKRKEEKRNKL